MECSDIGFPFLFGYRLTRTFFTYNGSDRSKPIILRPHPHLPVAQCNVASLRVLEREEREDPGQLCSFVFFSEEEWMTGNWSY